MIRTSRFTSLLSIVAAGLMFTSALAVEPGETVDLKATASVAPCLTDVLLDPNAPDGVDADAACDDIIGVMQSRANLEQLILTDASAGASAGLVYEFDVDAAEGTEGNMVDGTLVYAMSWRGVTKSNDSSTLSVDLKLTVEDISGPGDPMEIATFQVHQRDCLEPDAPCLPDGIDVGSDQDVAEINLVRGNSYRVTASLATSGAVMSSAEASSAVADYMNDVGAENDPAGAWLDALVLHVGVDIDDLAKQVVANTLAIADNTLAIADNTLAIAVNTLAIEANTEAIGDLIKVVDILVDEVEAIKEALEDLGDEVANHTHTYLTGKGVGHNNTLAATGKAIGEDDPEIQPVKTNRGRSKKFVR
jgi:hypothetical protein